jgi:hypothetical protein
VFAFLSTSVRHLSLGIAEYRFSMAKKKEKKMKRFGIRRRKLGFHVFGKDSSMLLDVAFLNGTVSELTVVRLASKNFSGKLDLWSSSNNQSSGTVV